MNPFFFYHAAKNGKDKPDEHPVVHNESLHNTNEGSEFLDDAIHMEELPLIYTEDGIAVGSSQNLL